LEDAAKNAYAEIYQANKRHEGVEIVPGLGDEAYYHSDGTNFYFFLVRKDKRMFRLKLNKVTSHSSVMNFKEVARLITDRL
jgi:ribosomal protein L24E